MSSDKPNTPKFPRGSEIENSAYTGESGTLSVDVENQRLILHDGETRGGHQVGVEEAPKDGNPYHRRDGKWVQDGTNLPEVKLNPSHYQVKPNIAFVSSQGSGYIDDEGRLFICGDFYIFQAVGFVEVMPEKRFTQVSSDIWSEGFIALDTEGYIWAMGSGYDKQYGPDTYNGVWPPQKLDPNHDWAYIHASEYYATFAIKKDGTLWSLGDDTFGYLGRPADGAQETFGQVGTRDDHISVDGLYWKGTSVCGNGDVLRWGYNFEGYAIGDGHEEDVYEPVAVASRTPGKDWLRQTVDGAYTSVIIGSDGKLYAAGEVGELATGKVALPVNPQPGDLINDAERFSWVPISDDTDWDWVGGQGAWYGFLAVKKDGSLWAWDYFYNDDGDWVFYLTPTQLLPGVKVVDVKTCYEQVYVVLSDEGDVYCWGENWSGMVGDGRGSYEGDDTYMGTGIQDYVLTPTKVLTDVEWVETGYWMTLAKKKDGSIWTWGQNWNGSAGVPNSVYNEIAVPFKVPARLPLPPIPGPTELVKGDMDFGYFGTVTRYDLIDGSDLAEALDANPSGYVSHYRLWAKIALNGKICFVGLHAARDTISYETLENKNLIDINEDSGRASISGYDLKARLMTGGSGDVHTPDGDVSGSEWDRIFSMLSSESPVPAEDRWDSLSNSALGFDGSDGSWTWVKEKLEGDETRAVLRGGSGPFGIMDAPVTEANATYAWRPILEVVAPLVDPTIPHLVIN